MVIPTYWNFPGIILNDETYLYWQVSLFFYPPMGGAKTPSVCGPFHERTWITGFMCLASGNRCSDDPGSICCRRERRPCMADSNITKILLVSTSRSTSGPFWPSASPACSVRSDQMNLPWTFSPMRWSVPWSAGCWPRSVCPWRNFWKNQDTYGRKCPLYLSGTVPGEPFPEKHRENGMNHSYSSGYSSLLPAPPKGWPQTEREIYGPGRNMRGRSSRRPPDTQIHWIAH